MEMMKTKATTMTHPLCKTRISDLLSTCHFYFPEGKNQHDPTISDSLLKECTSSQWRSQGACGCKFLIFFQNPTAPDATNRKRLNVLVKAKIWHKANDKLVGRCQGRWMLLKRCHPFDVSCMRVEKVRSRFLSAASAT